MLDTRKLKDIRYGAVDGEAKNLLFIRTETGTFYVRVKRTDSKTAGAKALRDALKDTINAHLDLRTL